MRGSRIWRSPTEVRRRGDRWADQPEIGTEGNEERRQGERIEVKREQQVSDKKRAEGAPKPPSNVSRRWQQLRWSEEDEKEARSKASVGSGRL